MKKLYAVTIITLFAVTNVTKDFAQGIGINSTGSAPDPSAMLHVDVSSSSSKGSLVTGTYTSSGTVPDLGAGTRMMFYPGKSAFRAGYVNGSQWNNANTGFFSVAMGGDNIASGNTSTAMGAFTTASGTVSTAMGNATIASGNYSTAIGYTTTASAPYSTALGYTTTASGNVSTAMGNQTTASGLYSTAMGEQTTASGINSTVMGYNSTASGDYSVAIGTSVSTNLHAGSFFFGDTNPNGNGIRLTSKNDQISMRFNGGYYFLSDDNPDIGVQVLPAQNSWSVISDVNRKENFSPVDGESFLQKISTMNLTSWNYKKQDPKTFRHYGPMAQDFYAAFGKDDMGTIGCDTLINQQDFLGVNLIAIQALEKRTADLKNELTELKGQNAALNKKLADKDETTGEVNELKKQNESLKQSVAQLQQQFKAFAAKDAVTGTVAAK